MSQNFFENDKAMVGGKEVAFSRRVVRERYSMYVPASFSEDTNLVSNYTYLFSKDKSPLSIAIKFTPSESQAENDKLITRYFSQATETLTSETWASGNIVYRETVTSNQYFSIYSLRFSVEVEGGLLFGCFNCSADYKDDWHTVVLQMLQSIQRI